MHSSVFNVRSWLKSFKSSQLIRFTKRTKSTSRFYGMTDVSRLHYLVFTSYLPKVERSKINTAEAWIYGRKKFHT